MTEITALNPPDVRPPSASYSTVVVAGDLVFVAGQGPFDVAGAIVGETAAEQTEQVIENLKRALAAVECDLSRAVKVSVFLADLADAPAFNAVYSKHFQQPYPVRTTVEAGLRGFLVEIDVIAARR
jgi:2-iminobutanoate/2-iminopropanoate deaminase